MPVYEFYCKKCHTLFNFYSSRINTEKIPQCPRCKDVKLERQMSVFSSISSSDNDDGDNIPVFDESKMEKALNMLAGEADKINDDDPKQAAMLMKKLSRASGMKLGSAMEEALSRMERGEDPEAIEAEMGGLLEGEEPFLMEEKKKSKKGEKKPEVDETLYEL
ncbi:MAG: zinc ribbon domain-containing protein [Deltaproteobacteria bacterium]|nr:zinc ribbon domain-containing protein [Deltaproteobacteria bacterium]